MQPIQSLACDEGQGAGGGAALGCRAVPTDKRQRQKEGRRARLGALRRVERRRRLVRRTIWVVVIAAAIIGSVVLLLPGTKPLPKDVRLQDAANKLAVEAGCPSSPYTVVDTTKSWKHPPHNILSKHRDYFAEFKTTAGDFTVKLDPAEAPANVNSFVFLAEHGFYNCTDFQRVIPGFMDQGGSPSGGWQDDHPKAGSSTEPQGPGYTVKADEYPHLPKHGDIYKAGVLAVANSNSPHTNGSQFFVMAKSWVSKADCGNTNDCLPPSYTVIGAVVSGQKVVDKINAEGNASTSSDGVPPVIINRVLAITIYK